MKKITVIIFLLISTFGYSQTDTAKKSINLYISGGISTSTGNNFNQNSYPSIEFGVCLKNTMFGFATGRGNFDFSSDDIQNYWFEVKTYAYIPVGKINFYILAGWGQYYSTTHNFIEYGLGANYSIKKIGLSVSVSNWDNIVYVSPGISYNF